MTAGSEAQRRERKDGREGRRARRSAGRHGGGENIPSRESDPPLDCVDEDARSRKRQGLAPDTHAGGREWSREEEGWLPAQVDHLTGERKPARSRERERKRKKKGKAADVPAPCRRRGVQIREESAHTQNGEDGEAADVRYGGA